MTYDFNNYKKDISSRPRDLAWTNWAKFEKVGDKVQGFIRDVFYRPEEGKYKEQRGITLEQEDGTFINVAIKRLSFVLAGTDEARLGDPLTVELVELKENKGMSATKIFAYYHPKPSLNPDQKTVKELDAIDMAAGGTVTPEAEEADTAVATGVAPTDVKAEEQAF